MSERSVARGSRIPRPVWILMALMLGGLLVWGLWLWSQDRSGIRREAPKMQTIIPLPPPPPPPEEPPPPPPEPVEQEIPDPEPEPDLAEEPMPEDEAPSPSDDLAEAMQIDGEAQAGSDAFNIGAGSGRGMAGAGGGRIGNATYSQYLGWQLQKILREAEQTRYLTFRMQVHLWINDGGQITRVEVVSSSGDAETDARVVEALRAVPRLSERPPSSLSLPVKVLLQGRRPG